MTNYKIAIDAMGGDYGPSVTVPAALRAVQQHPKLTLILVGDQDVLSRHLAKRGVEHNAQIIIQHASEKVEMNELPSQALRLKKDSSMRVAVNLVKEKQAQACVSAGNTGALMATARFVLKTLPGIDRPAITTALPTTQPGTTVRMLDLGANVDSSADLLFQFAVMGSVLAEFIDDIKSPKVALLNIGEEEIKGNEQVKATAALLHDCPYINYTGYIEGTGIYRGEADVIVSDGFVGNVALKSSEGTAALLSHYMRNCYTKNFFTRLIGLLSRPVLNDLKAQIDPAQYNGASLVGLQGIVVKSHGRAHPRSFASAIDEAVSQVEHNIPQRLSEKLAEILNK